MQQTRWGRDTPRFGEEVLRSRAGTQRWWAGEAGLTHCTAPGMRAEESPNPGAGFGPVGFIKA